MIHPIAIKFIVIICISICFFLSRIIMSEKQEVFMGKKRTSYHPVQDAFSYKTYLANLYYNYATHQIKFLVILSFPFSNYAQIHGFNSLQRHTYPKLQGLLIPDSSLSQFQFSCLLHQGMNPSFLMSQQRLDLFTGGPGAQGPVFTLVVLF